MQLNLGILSKIKQSERKCIQNISYRRGKYLKKSSASIQKVILKREGEAFGKRDLQK